MMPRATPPRVVVHAAAVLAGAALIFSLTWLWHKTRSLVPEEHARIDSALRELRSLDRAINQDVLQARFQLIGNYDPVRRSYRRIEQLEATLATPPLYLDRDFRQRMTAAVAEYRAVVTTKQHLIEDIKYRTLNLLELLAYLPGAGTGTARAASQSGDAALAAMIDEALQQTLFYNLTSDLKYAPVINDKIDALERVGRKSRSYLVRRRVRTLALNIRTLLAVKPEVDRNLRRIFEQPVAAHEENVAAIYYAGYAAAERVAGRYRVLLYVLCVGLLALVAYGVRRLQRTAKALAISNEQLEARVLDRTRELDARNRELRTALDNVARSEAGFRSLIEQAFDGIAVHQGGVVVYATAALATFLRQLAPSELVGRPAAELVPEADRSSFEAATREIKAVGERANLGETWLVGRDGEPRPAEISSVGAIFDGALATVTIFHDLSERKRLEQQTLALEKSERERLAKEFEIAQRIQRSLVPLAPTASGLEIAGRMRPASEMGGDYYDLIPAGDRCWIGIGDVAGHGLDAGLIMLMVQTAVSALTRHATDPSPSAVLKAINEIVYDNLRNRLGQSTFVTFTLLHHDGNGGFTFAGGHEVMLVRRAATGRCERVDTPGPWIGVAKAIDGGLVVSRLQLEPGDVLFLYTDGITEARDAAGEQFGLDRLCAAIEQQPDAPPEKLCSDVLDLVAGWHVSQEDDLTTLAIRYRGARIDPLFSRHQAENPAAAAGAAARPVAERAGGDDGAGR